MAYSSILCSTCEGRGDTTCYCAPNSVCGMYREKKKGIFRKKTPNTINRYKRKFI